MSSNRTLYGTISATAPYGDTITQLDVKFTPEQPTTPSLMPETNSVYLTRPTEGTGELMELVGGTVAWNQLCNSSSVTGTSGHKFYLKKSGVESITNTNTFTGLASGTDMVTDLTQMLGSTIADYVYSLEQATAGSGIAWLKSYGYFTEDYIAYSAPTLQSVEASAHVTVGKNLLDTTGTLAHNNYNIAGFPNKLKPNTTYVYSINGTTSNRYALYLSTSGTTPNSTTTRLVGYLQSGASASFTTPSEMSEDWLIIAGSSNGAGNEDITTIKPQIELGSIATAYEPYTETTYPFGTTTLRGIPKLNNGSLYYDGDTYECDGTVNRRFAEVDLGSLSWNKVNASTGHWRFGVSIASMKGTGGNSTKFKCVCTKYLGITPNESYTGVTGITANGADGALFVCDESYSDAAAFKTAMSGVMLVYEMVSATTESADPFTAVQTVEDGGTEEFVTTNGVPVGVVGRFANAVPMEGVDSFTVTANDGTSHTYPVTLSEEIYRGYVDMLTGEAVSDMASIAEYNGETINAPWLSSLDVYSLGATPTRGAQVVYPITPEEVTATITGDPTELGEVTSVTSTKGTVKWGNMMPLGLKAELTIDSPF